MLFFLIIIDDYYSEKVALECFLLNDKINVNNLIQPSDEGPQLFAVKPDQSVWYHDENQWHRYQTATDVKYDQIHSPDLNPRRGTFTSTTDDDDDEPRFSEEEGLN
ncbi:unnamed protein product [Rotaria sordida]|uniref:Uncharacterized protein n=1 Tax=Rotaria sordida TaxID=392033 RepID=A0A815QS59_9BILA|nr:unnamed protein product [Rotaria sordida]